MPVGPSPHDAAPRALALGLVAGLLAAGCRSRATSPPDAPRPARAVAVEALRDAGLARAAVPARPAVAEAREGAAFTVAAGAAVPSARVRGSFADHEEAESETCGVVSPDGAEGRVTYHPSHPAFVVERAAGAPPVRVWARGHNPVVLVAVDRSDPEGVADCTVAGRGAPTVIDLRAPRASRVEVFVATHLGARGQWVAGLTGDLSAQPQDLPPPVAPPAPNEVRAHFEFGPRVEDDAGQPVSERTLVLEGAIARRITVAPPLESACRSASATDPAGRQRGQFGLQCYLGGFHVVSVHNDRGRTVQVVDIYQSDGMCPEGECPTTTRVRARFELPVGGFLAAHPAGVVSSLP